MNTIGPSDFYFFLSRSSQNSKSHSNVGNGFIIIGLTLEVFIIEMA